MAGGDTPDLLTSTVLVIKPDENYVEMFLIRDTHIHLHILYQILLRWNDSIMYFKYADRSE